MRLATGGFRARPKCLAAVTDFAVAFYVGNDRASMHHSWSITVLTLRGEHIAEITSFLGGEHFASFGMLASLS